VRVEKRTLWQKQTATRRLQAHVGGVDRLAARNGYHRPHLGPWLNDFPSVDDEGGMNTSTLFGAMRDRNKVTRFRLGIKYGSAGRVAATIINFDHVSTVFGYTAS
jgi:hypothetical protein